ncbi:MAG: cytochrome c3 family protein, partial [Gammaproteobacteria bacterium]|nr:cytochrome c3 family protein [Gammaproteobacteria bacterium]
MKTMSTVDVVRRLFIFFVLCFTNAVFLNISVAETAMSDKFDHSETGFMLSGQHNILSCESCHVRGIFKGIPRTCEGCHERVAQIASSIKPVNHLYTNASCDDCHMDSSWTIVRMDHSELTGACDSCHNGSKAEGKPADHIVSSFNCDNCHLTLAWLPARFDHSNITAACSTCHDGVTATGKSVTHVSTSL